MEVGNAAFAVLYSIFGSDVPFRCSSAAGVSLSKDFRQHIKALSIFGKLVVNSACNPLKVPVNQGRGGIIN